MKYIGIEKLGLAIDIPAEMQELQNKNRKLKIVISVLVILIPVAGIFAYNIRPEPYLYKKSESKIEPNFND